MADFVDVAVIIALLFAVFLWWDNNIHAGCRSVEYDLRCVITSVCHKILRCYSFNKMHSLLAISSGAFCDKDSDRHTRRIHGKVNLGVEPPFVRLIS